MAKKKLFRTLKKKAKKMDLWDIGCVKWSSLLLGAIIGAYISGFVKQYLVWFIVIAVIIALKPVAKWFKKD